MNTTKTTAYSAAIAALLCLVGCESVGTIGGVSSGGPVQFDYQQGFLATDGVLNVVMPDGERFSGKFVQQSETRAGHDWQFGKGGKNNGAVFGSSENKSSSVKALLLGDRNSTMKCEFQFSSPARGMKGGGIGECDVSDGRDVNITF